MAPMILTELDKWMEPGSTVRVLIDGGPVSEKGVDVPGLRARQLSVTTTYNSAPQKIADLCAEESYDWVVVLCYRTKLTAEEGGCTGPDDAAQAAPVRQDHPERSRQICVLNEVLDIRDVQLIRRNR